MQVACSLCSETMERDILDIHRDENCPRRMVTCEFCEFPLPAIDLVEHQVVFANDFLYLRSLHQSMYSGINFSLIFKHPGSMRESNRTLSPL